MDAGDLANAARIGLRLVMGDADRESAVTMLRAKGVAVTADPPMPTQADGEPHGTTPFTAELIAGGLTVLAPPPS